jgi:hypothetical protein
VVAINANMDATQAWVPLSVADAQSLEAGFYELGDESIRVRWSEHATTDTTSGVERAIDGRWVERGVGGTTAATHDSGATLTRYYPEAPGGAGGGSVTVTDGTTTVENVMTVQAPRVSEDSPGVAIIVPVIVSDAAPTVPEGFFWLRQTDDGNSYQLYVYWEESWIQASAGLGAGDYGDGFEDQTQRQVGFFDVDNGALVGISVDAGGRQVKLQSTSVDGNDMAELTMTPTAVTIEGAIHAPTLPTADPNVAGQLWNDNGTLKVSAGA